MHACISLVHVIIERPRQTGTPYILQGTRLGSDSKLLHQIFVFVRPTLWPYPRFEELASTPHISKTCEPVRRIIIITKHLPSLSSDCSHY